MNSVLLGVVGAAQFLSGAMFLYGIVFKDPIYITAAAFGCGFIGGSISAKEHE